jgi:hypothetical protein
VYPAGGAKVEPPGAGGPPVEGGPPAQLVEAHAGVVERRDADPSDPELPDPVVRGTGWPGGAQPSQKSAQHSTEAPLAMRFISHLSSI